MFDMNNDPIDPSAIGRLFQFLETVLSEDVLANACAIIGGDDLGMDDPAPTPGTPKAGGDFYAFKKESISMDTSIIAEMQKIRAAEAAVEPIVGPVIGMDSASGVYREALKRLGQPTNGVHPTALRLVFETACRRRGAGISMAVDSKAANGFAKRYPNAVPFKAI